MNYKRIYENLIDKAAGRIFVSGIHERHHIVPKSFGGTDDKSNIAILTYREHFIAHWLLTKFTKGIYLRKMKHALLRLTSKSKSHKGKIISSWQYDLAKRLKSEAMIGNQYSKGHIQTEESRNKMSESWKRRGPVSEETRAKQSASRIGNDYGKANKGILKPEEWRYKMSRGGNGRAKKIICINDTKVFDCIIDLCDFYGVSRTGVGNVLNGKWTQTKGLRFEYARSE